MVALEIQELLVEVFFTDVNFILIIISVIIFSPAMSRIVIVIAGRWWRPRGGAKLLMQNYATSSGAGAGRSVASAEPGALERKSPRGSKFLEIRGAAAAAWLKLTPSPAPRFLPRCTAFENGSKTGLPRPAAR